MLYTLKFTISEDIHYISSSEVLAVIRQKNGHVLKAQKW